jgi:uncharacterized protein (DUF2249 family)
MYLNLTKFVGSKYDVNHELEMDCSNRDVHHITEMCNTYNEAIDVITILKGDSNMENYAKIIRAPEYPPQLKHKVIFETFDSLNDGEALLLINDHDPRPLFFQFQATRAGQFSWDYIQQGPDEYQVKIAKIA